MSGSYDRPTAPPLRLDPQAFDHGDAPTGVSGRGHDQFADAPPVVPQRRDEPDLVAESRGGQDKEQAGTPIVPAGSVTGRSLTLVIAIMCCLACLTAGAVYMINRAASSWLRDIASEITIQVEPRERAETDKLVREVATFIARQPGVVAVKPLGNEASTALLEPWLGQTDALKALPVPQLIALEIDNDPGRQPDLAALRTLLAKQFKGVTLDDHRHWQTQIKTVTRSFALGGLAILLLVAAATTAIIVSATRSAMAANREIVEVLHFVGATDRFIAREFSRHFLRLGIRSGIVGALMALVVFHGMPTMMEVLGGGAVTLAELSRLVGSGRLDALGHIFLALVVFVIAALCMLTSRYRVYRILHERP